HTCLAEVFLLGNGTDRGDGLLDITGNELAITTHTALQINKMVRLADGADALGDRFTLAGEVLVCVARGCHILLGLLQARFPLWGAARAALGRLAVDTGGALLQPLERLFRLGDSLVGCSLFDGHGSCHGLAQFMLHIEEIRRMMRPEMMSNIRQKPWRLIACR